jgi:hypothetical protein
MAEETPSKEVFGGKGATARAMKAGLPIREVACEQSKTKDILFNPDEDSGLDIWSARAVRSDFGTSELSFL